MTAKPTRPLSVGLNGSNLVIVGLYLWQLIACRTIFYTLGFTLQLQTVSRLGNTAAVFLLVIGTYIHLGRNKQQICPGQRLISRVRLWYCLVGVLVLYGLVRNNDWTLLGKEALALVAMGCLLVLGADDQFWPRITDHLTILFYWGIALVLLYSQTPAVQVSAAGVLQDFSGPLAYRNSNTMGYDLRAMIETGWLLGAWGMVSTRWSFRRILALGAPFALLACEAGVFRFRGAVVTFVALWFSASVLRPALQRKLRVKTLVLASTLSCIGLFCLASTDSWQVLKYRAFEETSTNGWFAIRNQELTAYVSDMRWEMALGRGIGGTFDARGVAQRDFIDRWPTLHYGALVFTLKGGILLCLCFLSFFLPGFSVRTKEWYNNPCNGVAAILFPLYVVQFTIVPIPITAERLFFMVPPMLMCARFVKPQRFATMRIPAIEYRRLKLGLRTPV